jgi:hypothetical protein
MRATLLLDSVAGLNDQAVATKNGVNPNTVVCCMSAISVAAGPLGPCVRSSVSRSFASLSTAWPP